MQSFSELVGSELANRLAEEGFTQPTDVQQQTIPILLEGKSLVAVSNTGTGKTLAYLLPIVCKIDLANKSPQAFIITPTHELAAQVFKEAKRIAYKPELEPALIIGGADIKRQIERLKDKPRIIIGSAGRILELIKMRKLTGHFVKTFVVDEADRLFDETNFESTRDLIKTTLKDRQLVLLSASMNDDTLTKAREFAGEMTRINLSAKRQLPENIEHMYFVSESRDKIEVLRKIVHSEKIEKAIVFLNNPNEIEMLTKRLNYHEITATQLFGAAYKKERKQALADFAAGRAKLLVASDIAARGLDIDGVTHIINMEAPENPVFYLHRAGRCGRMGKPGTCIILAENREISLIKKIERKFSVKIVQKKIKYGNIKDMQDQKTPSHTKTKENYYDK